MNPESLSIVRRLFGKRSVAAAMAVAVVAGLGGVAAAVTVGGGTSLGFEIEGDFVDDPSGGPKDWTTVTPVMVDDDTADSGFTQGSKELKPSQWVCGNGGADPSKGDLLRAYAHTRVSAAGAYVDLAWVAQNVQGEGDVHLNFEFSQDGTAQDPDDWDGDPAVACSIPRQANDLLITYDFPGGSALPAIKAFKWQPLATPTGNADGTWVDLNLTDAAADAAVSQADLTDPFDGTVSAQRFGEATIDIIAALGANAISGCQDFGYLNVRSRSSGESESSAIQDKLPTTAIDLNTCGKITLHKVDDHDPAQPLEGATFGLFDNANATGEPLQTQASDADGKVVFENVEPGEYWVKELEAPEGYSADPDIVGPIDVDFREFEEIEEPFVDPRDTGTVRIVKKLVDENGDPIVPDDASDLDGASFVVFKDGNANGTYQAGEEAKLWPAETDDAECTISGGAGFCDVGPLPTGTYGVHETVPPAGTTAGDDVYPVVIDEDGEVVTVNFVNSLSPLNITIDKSGPDEAHRGDVITYTFKASTTGPKLHDVVVEELGTDRCDGAISGPVKTGGDQDAFLEVGEIWTYSCTHEITANDPDPLPNEAKVTGTDDFGRDVSDTDTHNVDILEPLISLDKKVEGGDHKPIANALQAHEGETLHYTITIRNEGDAPLDITTLTDSIKANLPASCTAGIGAELLPNGTITCAYTMTAPSTDVHNTASVTGTDNIGGTASASDETFVDVIHPSLVIVKDGTDVAHEGDPTHYTFDVTNTGDVDLTNVLVQDNVFGDIGTIASLPAGETVQLTFDSVAPADDLTNVATACGDDPLEDEVCSPPDDHTLDVIHPSLVIVKDGTNQAYEGQPTHYTFAVTNTGDVDLTDVVVEDDVFGTIGTIALLEVNETETLTKDSTAPGSDLHNVATACGDDPLEDEVCSPPDDHTLDILHPNIDIEKTAATRAHEGDVVTYTFTVTNTGDSTLAPVVVTDDILGTIGTIPSLAPLADTELTKDFTVPTPSEEVENTAEACGVGPIGTTEFCDTDIHVLDVVHPSVTLDKKVNGGDHKPVGEALLAHEGQELNYTIVITNTGDIDLTLTELEDTIQADLPDDCSLGIGDKLEVGGAVTCTYNQTAPDEDVHNVASVVGVDELGGAKGSASASDETFVDVLHPAIEVIKEGVDAAHEGDTVIYTFKVTNVGDVDLTDVVVTDDVIGDIGTLDSLSVGQSTTLSKEFVVPADTDGVTNTATACGLDPTELEVCDDDSHSLIVIHPSLELVKTADPATGGPRDVTYSYEVTNTGDSVVTDIVVDDDILGEIGVIDELAPGESETLTMTVAVDGSSPTVNIGVACGDDELGKETCATDDAEIAVVLAAAVELPKTGFNLTMWLLVTALLLGLGAAALNLEVGRVSRRWGPRGG